MLVKNTSGVIRVILYNNTKTVFNPNDIKEFSYLPHGFTAVTPEDKAQQEAEHKAYITETIESRKFNDEKPKANISTVASVFKSEEMTSIPSLDEAIDNHNKQARKGKK